MRHETELGMIAPRDAVTYQGWMKLSIADDRALRVRGRRRRTAVTWELITESITESIEVEEFDESGDFIDDHDVFPLELSGHGVAVGRGGAGRAEGVLGDLRLSDIRWRRDGWGFVLTGNHDGGGGGSFEAWLSLFLQLEDRLLSFPAEGIRLWSMQADVVWSSAPGGRGRPRASATRRVGNLVSSGLRRLAPHRRRRRTDAG